VTARKPVTAARETRAVVVGIERFLTAWERLR
jgi:hypothetical protein